MSAARPLTTLTTAQRRWVLWLAVLLALFGALAPTVSHALNWARGGRTGLTEICTSNGPRWMALGVVQSEAALVPGVEPLLVADASGDPVSAAVFDHCPFCLLMADRAAPLPQAGVFLAMALGSAVAPVGWQVRLPSLSFALTPPPRGPPHTV
jgi:hypothetical protein